MEFKVGDKVRFTDKAIEVLSESIMFGNYIKTLADKHDYFTVDSIMCDKITVKESVVEWLTCWFEKVIEEEPKPIHDEIYLSYIGDVTVAVHEKTGVAIRSKHDKEDRKIGILIAVMRAVGFNEKQVSDVVDVLFDDFVTMEDLTNEELLEEIQRRMR